MTQDQTLFNILLVIGIVVVVYCLFNGNEKFGPRTNCDDVKQKCIQSGGSSTQCGAAHRTCSDKRACFKLGRCSGYFAKLGCDYDCNDVIAECGRHDVSSVKCDKAMTACELNKRLFC